MSDTPKRVLAIIGRPNVGKSAIFNRLVSRRIAIVHHESGVTRDRLVREVTWGNERLEVVDTGGICNVDGEAAANAIEQGIREQSDAALEDAAAVLFVVDVEAGITPMDEVVAEILRDRGCYTVMAVNKCDHHSRDIGSAEFEKFGFPVFPVSALHDRGFRDVMPDILAHLPQVENVSVEDPLKVAIVGRPNVGKSSFINRLLKHDRVIVSTIPGTTRDSIDIPFQVGKGDQARHYLLMDTAGMRRTGKIDNPVERFSKFRAENSVGRANVVVLVMDAETGPTTQDKKIAALIQKYRKGAVVIVNKWDLSESTQRQYGPAVAKEMPFMGHCPLVFLSAKTGYNIRHSIEAIDLVASQVRADIQTSLLNQAVVDACERVHPQSVQGKRLKIFYCTQIGREPIRIRMFVNNPKLVRSNYREYLVRSLREKFGFEGAPLSLEFRARPRKV